MSDGRKMLPNAKWIFLKVQHPKNKLKGVGIVISNPESTLYAPEIATTNTLPTEPEKELLSPDNDDSA